MDTTTLMLSLLFGMVGMGFLMYGKNAGQMVPIGAGLCLMICPYFLPQCPRSCSASAFPGSQRLSCSAAPRRAEGRGARSQKGNGLPALFDITSNSARSFASLPIELARLPADRPQASNQKPTPPLSPCSVPVG